jgi:vacuolar protein sorting-associated protein 13A/C
LGFWGGGWIYSFQANTFFPRPGRKRPPKRLALDLADFRKVTRPDNLTVDAEIKRISATFFDDFGGLVSLWIWWRNISVSCCQ